MRLLLILLLAFNTVTAQSTFFGVLAGDGGYRYDASALAYIDSVDNYVSLTLSQRKAIDTFFRDIKGQWSTNARGYSCSSIWDSLNGTMGYLPLWNNSSANAINLFSPNQYKLVTSGTPTLRDTGVIFGSNSYYTVSKDISTLFLTNSISFSFYCRNNVTTGGQIEISVINNTNTQNTSLSVNFIGVASSDLNNDVTNRISIAQSNSIGFYQGTRFGATSHHLLKNGTSIVSGSNTAVAILSNTAHPINFGRSQAGGGYGSTKATSFFSATKGMNTTQALHYWNAIQALHQRLNKATPAMPTVY